MLDGDASWNASQKSGDWSLPWKSINGAIHKNKGVWLISSNDAKPVPQGPWIFRAFDSYWPQLLSVYAGADYVLAKANDGRVRDLSREPAYEFK
jgi:hypothetical protein